MMQEAADTAQAATEAVDPLAAFKDPAISLIEQSEQFDHAGGPVEELFFRTAGQNETAVFTDSLFLLTLWFSVFFFVLLMGLMVYWVIKYRRRPGVPAEVSPAHNGPLEILWTVVPSSSMIIMFLLGFQGYMQKTVAPADAIQLQVEGQKWDWNIRYPGGEQSAYFTSLGTKINAVKIFVLPEDTPIQLKMTSKDVIHAFWIPDYRTKMDLYPNRYTTITFKTEKLNAGEAYRDHWVFCAEYCGDLHSQMFGVLRVVSRENYDKILQDWNTGNLSPEAHGEVLFKSNCVSCHSVDGSNNIGPTWKNLYGYERPISGGTSVVADDTYILESIWNPTKKIVAGYEGQNMTNFAHLTQEEVSAIIAYMKTLSDKGGAAEDAPVEGENEESQESTGG